MSRPVYVARRRTSLADLVIVALLVGLVGYATHWHPFAGSQVPAQASAASAPGGGVASPGELAGADKAVAFALRQVGDSYVWAGDGPKASGGWDCSGLVAAAWAQAGRTIPRSTQAQWAGLRHTSRLAPGVLILYQGAQAYPGEKPPGHVALYIGHGEMVEAYDIAVGVRKTGVRPGWWGLALPLAA